MDTEDLSSQAHRLLRERWKSAESLSQELYSMLLPGTGGGPEFTGTQARAERPEFVRERMVKAAASEANVVSRVIRRDGTVSGVEPVEFDAPAVRPPDTFSRRQEDAVLPFQRRQEESPQFITVPPIPSRPNRGQPSPAVPGSPYGPPLQEPENLIPRKTKYHHTVGMPALVLPEYSIVGGDGGGGGILGLVTSGSGDTYQVDLYANGKNSASTASVTVLIPQIADDEDIPDGTWIGGIMQVTSDAGTTEYWYQPPVWLG